MSNHRKAGNNNLNNIVKKVDVCEFCPQEFKDAYFKTYLKHQPRFDKIKTPFLNPGDWVKIKWRFEYAGLIDEGYVIELPGMNHKEYNLMIHIPYPDSKDKGETPPLWKHLYQLLENPCIEEIRKIKHPYELVDRIYPKNRG